MVRRTDLRVVLTSAAITVCATLPFALPFAVTAEPEPTAAAGLVERTPTLTLDGVALTAAPTAAAPAPEAAPTFTLRAHNPGAERRRVSARLALRVVPASSLYARMPSLPREAWTGEVVFELDPGAIETRVIAPGVLASTGDTFELVAASTASVPDPAEPGVSLVAYAPAGPAEEGPPLVRPRVPDTAVAAPSGSAAAATRLLGSLRGLGLTPSGRAAANAAATAAAQER